MRYSPTRILGALRRRQLDWFRGFVYRIFSKAKLSNSILFESFQGKVIGDNPYAIFTEVLSRNPSFELVDGRAKGGFVHREKVTTCKQCAAQHGVQSDLLPCGHSSDNLGNFGGCNPMGSCVICDAATSR